MKLHHIGYVVSDIATFQKSIIFNEKIFEIYDPIQMATLALYSSYSDVFIELIQPQNSDSFTWNSLCKFGNHFHHLCYQISKSDLDRIVFEKKLIHVSGPFKAILFDNQLVDFYYNRNKELIEFLIHD